MGGQPLVTACMFCLLCATQSHCSSHHEASPSPRHLETSSPAAQRLSLLVQTAYPNHLFRRGKVKRGLDNEFVKSVFRDFGDGETLSRQGFLRLLESLGLAQETHHHHIEEIVNRNITNSSEQTIHKNDCMDGEEMLGQMENLSAEQYVQLCPAILHQLLPTSDGSSRCHHHHEHQENNVSTNQAAVWVYASLSVLLISLCGLLAVAVIPLMHKAVYHSLLQYLVALAVGTLCGDALLHLLPHAMMASHSHGEGSLHRHEEEDQHDVNLWRGLVAALSLTFFYFTEKCLSFLAKWRKTFNQKHKFNTKVRVMRDDGRQNEGNGSSTRVGEKLCKHKYSSHPYCYGEIANSAHPHQHGNGEPEINSIKHIDDMNSDCTAVKNIMHETDKEDVAEKQLLNSGEANVAETYTTIILREHETVHHGHAHTHGHVHSAPGSLSSVAWMVVMGDGLHNFTDGLAIGAAFAANIGGGISTAVAVFCHELPHELGDFAVLLKAGMSAKQAVFYNMLSSVLCLVGMCIGVLLGHNETTTLWVFSAAAGMFLYIALVDMIPELTSSHSDKGTLCQCLLQVGGILTGIGVMLLIALYEQNLKEAFKNSF